MVFLGYGRLYLAQHGRERFSRFLILSSGVGQTGQASMTLSGVIDSDPSEMEKGSSAYVNVGMGVIRVGLPRYPLLWRGQLLTVRGKVALARDGTTWTMPEAIVVRVEDPRGVAGLVFQARREVITRMGKLFPGSSGGFLVGVLAGGSRGMSRSIIDDVRATGLTHVIAVSGYNVTIVLNLIIGVFAYLPRRWKALPVGAFLVLFILFVGLSASALRAAIMGFLSVYALAVGRKRDLLLALLWSAIFMLLWKPFMLVEDRGFQLSFLATIGVCYIAPIMTSRIPSTLSPWIRELLLEPFLMTFAVYLATLPVLFSFEQFSLIGLVTNIIFVPFIPFCMILAALVLGLSFIYFPFALFLGHLGTIFIDLYFLLLHQFAILPFSNIQVPQMARSFVMSYYHVLCAVVFRITRRSGSHRTRRWPSSSRRQPHRLEFLGSDLPFPCSRFSQQMR
ncbi:MAG: ComEC/Rec2 family competence protein [Candidatus Gracilibacteria bacterium]